MSEECIICGEQITTKVLLPCNHHNFCLKCFETMTKCYNEKKCPFCQREVTKHPLLTSTQLTDESTYDEVLNSKKYHYDTRNGYYYEKRENLIELMDLMKYHCRDCEFTTSSFVEMKKHLKAQHDKKFCNICFNAKRFLPCDLETYSLPELKEHSKHQHMKCSCCKCIEFDYNSLSKHMRENHFRCDVCAERGQIRWFPTVEAAQKHFQSCHFACKEKECVEQGFIVFGTRTELLLHQVNVHGANPSILHSEIEVHCHDCHCHDDCDTERKHQYESSKRLHAALIKEFTNDTSKCSVIEKLVKNVNAKRITVDQFAEQLNKEADKSYAKITIPVIAAITDFDIRSLVSKRLQGITDSKPTQPSLKTSEDSFPSLLSSTSIDPKPSWGKKVSFGINVGKSKGKGKKIVLSAF